MSTFSSGDRHILTVVAEISGYAHTELSLGIGLGVILKPIMATCVCQVNRVTISSNLEQILETNFHFVSCDKDGINK